MDELIETISESHEDINASIRPREENARNGLGLAGVLIAYAKMKMKEYPESIEVVIGLLNSAIGYMENCEKEIAELCIYIFQRSSQLAC